MAVIARIYKNRFKRTEPTNGIQVEYKRGVYINYIAMYVFFKDRNTSTGTYLFMDMEGGQCGARPTEFS